LCSASVEWELRDALRISWNGRRAVWKGAERNEVGPTLHPSWVPFPICPSEGGLKKPLESKMEIIEEMLHSDSGIQNRKIY
jgi:hypothetical protein